jgi:hypothetical protein
VPPIPRVLPLPSAAVHPLSVAAADETPVPAVFPPPLHKTRRGTDPADHALRPRVARNSLLGIPKELWTERIGPHLGYRDIAALQAVSSATYDFIDEAWSGSFVAQQKLERLSASLIEGILSGDLYPDFAIECARDDPNFNRINRREVLWQRYESIYQSVYAQVYEAQCRELSNNPYVSNGPDESIINARVDEQVFELRPENQLKLIDGQKVRSALGRIMNDASAIDINLQPFLNEIERLNAPSWRVSSRPSFCAAESRRSACPGPFLGQHERKDRGLADVVRWYGGELYKAVKGFSSSDIRSLKMDVVKRAEHEEGGVYFPENNLHGLDHMLDGLSSLRQLELRSEAGSGFTYTSYMGDFSVHAGLNWKPPASMLNHNLQLEDLALLTNLTETMSCLLADTNQAVDQVRASPGIQNVKKLTLDAEAVAQIGDPLVLEYQATPGSGNWEFRTPPAQKQMCEVAFRGFTKAVEVCVAAGRGGDGSLRFEDRLSPNAPLQGAANPQYQAQINPFTPADITNILAQFPVMQKLELPEMNWIAMVDRQEQPVQEVPQPAQLAADTAMQLSLHPKLLSLQIGQTRFIRETTRENLSRAFGPERNPNPPTGEAGAVWSTLI